MSQYTAIHKAGRVNRHILITKWWLEVNSCQVRLVLRRVTLCGYAVLERNQPLTQANSASYPQQDWK